MMRYRTAVCYVWQLWQQQLSDCTPDRSYINDDESTVLGTDVPFAGSRDTVGKKGSSGVSGRKKSCNDDESDVLVWQQLSDCTADTQHPPSPARPTTAGIGTGTAVRSCINDRHWTAGSRDTVRKGSSSRVSILCINKQQSTKNPKKQKK